MQSRSTSIVYACTCRWYFFHILGASGKFLTGATLAAGQKGQNGPIICSQCLRQVVPARGIQDSAFTTKFLKVWYIIVPQVRREGADGLIIG